MVKLPVPLIAPPVQFIWLDTIKWSRLNVPPESANGPLAEADPDPVRVPPDSLRVVRLVVPFNVSVPPLTVRLAVKVDVLLIASGPLVKAIGAPALRLLMV
jgi:hypothetical protein